MVFELDPIPKSYPDPLIGTGSGNNETSFELQPDSKPKPLFRNISGLGPV